MGDDRTDDTTDDTTDDSTERIRASALRLISELGYGSTNMERIAAEAGVGIGSIYRRWPDKPGLANELLASALDDMSSLYVEPPGSSARDRFGVLIDRAWGFAVAHPERFLLVEGYVDAPFVSDENRARKARLRERAGALLLGLGIDADPDLVEALVMGTFVSLLRRGHRPGADELAERLWRALVHRDVGAAPG